MSLRRFVLLDRDGTLIVERNYLSRPEDVQLLPAVLAGLQRLRRLGLGLAVITNQSGIGRGYFDQAALDAVHARLGRLLHEGGIHLDGIYVCPHLPEDDCACRKPATDLAEQAARDLGFEPAAAFVIGDKACDIELGQRLGATTLLVRTGYGRQFEEEGTVQADFVVDDLAAAAEVIAGQMQTGLR